MTRAVLGLGGNMGDRLAHLTAAVEALGETVISVSSGYLSPPWGDPGQPEYLNAVTLVDGAGLDGGDYRYWLELAGELERHAGRVRDPQRRFGPRPLDVDVVLAWDDAGEPVVSADPRLTIPHPRAHLRAFVLAPLAEILPAAELPGYGTVGELLGRSPVAGDLARLERCGSFVATAAGWSWEDGTGHGHSLERADGRVEGSSR